MTAQYTALNRDDGSPLAAAAISLLPKRTGNRLLDQLAAEPFDRLKPHLSVGMLPLGQRPWESSRAATQVYFPERGVISDLVTMRDGTTVEVGMIGREGMLGLPIILGDDVTPRDARVLHPGSAIRVHASALREEMERSPQLRAILLRYAQSYFNSVAQLAACNRTHVLEQRLAAWLLRARARAGQDQLVITHESIANALGVRRAGVTVAAQSLQSAGFIKYAHGRITIVDAEGLKGAACECHSVIEGEYGRLLGERQERALYSEC
jgi:CRP-like cAMP-binding protein